MRRRLRQIALATAMGVAITSTNIDRLRRRRRQIALATDEPSMTRRDEFVFVDAPDEVLVPPPDAPPGVEPPPPPRHHVASELGAHFGGMVASRAARALRRLRALLRRWFFEFSRLYCPEDTRTLMSSYRQHFERGLAADEIRIESDVWYAGFVEAMRGVNYQKATAIDAFAAVAAAEVRMALPGMVEQARRFAAA